MKKLSALILFIFILTALLFLFPKVAFAGVLFEDNFNDGNADGWVVVGTTGWNVVNGEYGISITPTFSVSNSLPGDTLWNPDWKDYVYEVDLRGVSGTDKNLVFHFIDDSNFYSIHHTGGYIYLEKFIATPGGGPLAPAKYYPLDNGPVYHFKVEVDGNHIRVFERENLLFDVIDTAEPKILGGKIGLRVGTGAVSPSEVYFDNVVVTSLEPSPSPTPTSTPTPTPSPTPTPTPKLIFIPGLGGSWNHQEIFLGIDQPQNAWYKTPFRDDYDGLIKTLQNAGYTLDQNLFVFYYDWLQPINQSANDLESYINTVVNPPSGTKVDVLGHSLGGLVGRTYVQNNPGSHKVNKLITAGSPHKGAPQVYKAWEGADLTGLLGEKERIGAGIILRLRGFAYPNLVSAIQNFVPSLGNLLFIDDYLKWNKTGNVKPELGMSQRNIWLHGLGVSSELLGLANTLVGTAGDTPRWLKIIERNETDKSLGRWQDGKPVGEEPALGDRAVLEESARLSGANVITLSGLDHGDLVKKKEGLEKVLEILGKTGVSVVEQPKIPFEPALVFTVASPVTLRVTDPLGRQVGSGVDPPQIPNATFSAQEKIIIIPQALDGEYKVEVSSENTGGSYNLLIGQLTQKDDIWSQYTDSVKAGETDTYNIPIDNTLVTTPSYLLKLINDKLSKLTKEIDTYNINLITRVKIKAKLVKISAELKPVPVFLRLGRNKQADKFVQKAILTNSELIKFAQDKKVDLILPSLREIQDLLGQLHDLL